MKYHSKIKSVHLIAWLRWGRVSRVTLSCPGISWCESNIYPALNLASWSFMTWRRKHGTGFWRQLPTAECYWAEDLECHTTPRVVPGIISLTLEPVRNAVSGPTQRYWIRIRVVKKDLWVYGLHTTIWGSLKRHLDCALDVFPQKACLVPSIWWEEIHIHPITLASYCKAAPCAEAVWVAGGRGQGRGAKRSFQARTAPTQN